MNAYSEDVVAVPVGTTLDRFIKKHQQVASAATGELSQLLRDIALAAKIVQREISRAGLLAVMGSFGTENLHGEAQQKLDVIAHIRFLRALRNGGEVAAVVSEEEDQVIHTGNPGGKYVVAIDPLDGSSNIDVNVSIGTIFSIYRRQSMPGTPAVEADFLQGGLSQVAAGYVLYGTSTMLVYSTGQGVNGFTYDSSLGEFFLSHPNITTPTDGRIYSCNEGNLNDFSTKIQQFISGCRNSKFTARYIGALIADVHRNLLKGGIYLYPATRATPAGKLRLLYEGFPMAFLVEQAGGSATDGSERLLTKTIFALHQRTPLVIGSTRLVEEATN